ncbi:MAG: glycosyltransferase [Kiritimatiellia bacterium]|nr:glycosyltransferase [Kiritimatiellia bacterium]
MKWIILSSLARDSGCALRARHLADALRRLGHDVVTPPLPRSLPFFLDLPLTAILALPAIFLRRYDAAVVIKPYPTLLLPLLLRRRLGGGKIVVDVDDIDFGYRSGIGSRLLAGAQRNLPARCDLVTTHNDSLAEHIRSFHRVHPSRMYRLDQGVALDLYRPFPAGPEAARSRTALRRTLNIGNRPMLIYTGHLNIASDLDGILEAFALTLRARPDARLVVAGGGPMQSPFEKMARARAPIDAIVFTGWKTPAQINELLNAADFALVYYRENEPNRRRVSMKIRECLAAGVPVIANDFGDLAQFRDVVIQSETSIPAFAEAIVSALNHPPERGPLAARTRERIAAQWDWDAIASAFADRVAALRP